MREEELRLVTVELRPRIDAPCRGCNGRGSIDLAYHGSPDFETCTLCRGSGRESRPVTELEWLTLLAKEK